MRLFIAVDIDEATRVQLQAARRAIEEVISKARVPPRVTWVKDDAAHVTLRFIGETPEEKLPSIQGALTAVSFDPFDVRWDTLGTFGGTRNPRVIWIAPTDGSDTFAALADKVNAQLDGVIAPGDARPFKPHLTLARVREAGRRVDWRRALAAVQWVPTVTRVTHVVLYQSRLSPKGPTYTALSTHG